MSTLVILLGFGALFALFALLGPAERSGSCGLRCGENPKCGHCPSDAPEVPASR
jgi:hypothetical protein